MGRLAIIALDGVALGYQSRMGAGLWRVPARLPGCRCLAAGDQAIFTEFVGICWYARSVWMATTGCRHKINLYHDNFQLLIGIMCINLLPMNSVLQHSFATRKAASGRCHEFVAQTVTCATSRGSFNA